MPYKCCPRKLARYPHYGWTISQNSLHPFPELPRTSRLNKVCIADRLVQRYNKRTLQHNRPPVMYASDPHINYCARAEQVKGLRSVKVSSRAALERFGWTIPNQLVSARLLDSG
eukprot:2457003-Amphidinium_carterae.1